MRFCGLLDFFRVVKKKESEVLDVEYMRNKLQKIKFVYKKFCTKQDDIMKKYQSKSISEGIQIEPNLKGKLEELERSKNRGITIYTNNSGTNSISIINNNKNFLNCSIGSIDSVEGRSANSTFSHEKQNQSVKVLEKGRGRVIERVKMKDNKGDEKDKIINSLQNNVTRLKSENYKLLNEILNLKIQLKSKSHKCDQQT